MNIKMVVLDLDGTLLKTKWTIHKKNLEAVKELYKKNIKVVIATGRSLRNSIKFALKLNIQDYSQHIVVFNGALIYKLNQKQQLEVIYEKYLGIKISKLLYDFANKNEIGFWGYDGKIQKNVYLNKVAKTTLKLRIFVLETFSRVKKFYITEKEYVDFNFDFIKVLLFCHNKKNLNETIEKLKLETELFEEIEFCYNEHFVIEITKKNVNKKTAIQLLAKKWDIKKEEILACGDGMNDYEILKWAKYGIVMENSSQELKNIAYYITKSNRKAGVAKALYKYCLEK
jgi:Cof subfamily protein (haloacid dehalogenase superfamily)